MALGVQQGISLPLPSLYWEGTGLLQAGLGSQLPRGAGNLRCIFTMQVLVSNLSDTGASLAAGTWSMRNTLTKFASMNAVSIVNTCQ